MVPRPLRCLPTGNGYNHHHDNDNLPGPPFRGPAPLQHRHAVLEGSAPGHHRRALSDGGLHQVNCHGTVEVPHAFIAACEGAEYYDPDFTDQVQRLQCLDLPGGRGDGGRTGHLLGALAGQYSNDPSACKALAKGLTSAFNRSQTEATGRADPATTFACEPHTEGRLRLRVVPDKGCDRTVAVLDKVLRQFAAGGPQRCGGGPAGSTTTPPTSTGTVKTEASQNDRGWLDVTRFLDFVSFATRTPQVGPPSACGEGDELACDSCAMHLLTHRNVTCVVGMLQAAPGEDPCAGLG